MTIKPNLKSWGLQIVVSDGNLKGSFDFMGLDKDGELNTANELHQCLDAMLQHLSQWYDIDAAAIFSEMILRMGFNNDELEKIAKAISPDAFETEQQ